VALAVEGESYLRHSAAMLHSLLWHHQNRPVLIDFLHCDDTSPRSRRRLAAMVSEMGGELRYHSIPDAWVTGLPVVGFTRKATWYRIWLERLLPDADRVLYLDVDLIVMDSLEELWKLPLEGRVLAAVTNVPPPHEIAYVERPELGVLIIDLDRIRREDVGEELRRFSVTNAERLKWRDQDALNEVLHARRLPLHPRWNFMNAMRVYPYATEYFEASELQEARWRPAIWHFEGPDLNKPWHVLCDPRQRRLYARHRARTPWRRAPLTGWTPTNIARGTWLRRRHILRRKRSALPARSD
jgi:lipopolysaccharide biosynthesis glycosyltransferase